MATLSNTHHWTDRLILHESARPQRRKCRVCLMSYDKAKETEYTLCPNCLADPASLLVLIDAQLAAVRLARDEACERWVARQVELPDTLGLRWFALVEARAKAEIQLEQAKRGERRARNVIPAGKLEGAEADWAAVLAKIDRTKKKDADISQLLSEEAAHTLRLDAWHLDRCRWEMARSDLEVATETLYDDEKPTLATIIAGGRDITDPAILEAALAACPWSSEINYVVSGDAKGVDTLGIDWALSKGIPVAHFPADWDTHGKAAGPIRNEAMASYAHALIAVWDGKSRGTSDMIDRAKAKGLRVFVFPTPPLRAGQGKD